MSFPKKQSSVAENKLYYLQFCKKAVMMKIILISLIFSIHCTTNMAISQKITIPGPYYWQNRILLVFSQAESNKSAEQSAVFNQHRQGMQDRDLVVFGIHNEQVENPEGETFGKEAASRLRTKYRISEEEFAVILIGKDGTEKLRQHEVLKADKLFATIDAMPMRRQEMRRSDGN